MGLQSDEVGVAAIDRVDRSNRLRLTFLPPHFADCCDMADCTCKGEQKEEKRRSWDWGREGRCKGRRGRGQTQC